jgi:hypothetical protein
MDIVICFSALACCWSCGTIEKCSASSSGRNSQMQNSVKFNTAVVEGPMSNLYTILRPVSTTREITLLTVTNHVGRTAGVKLPAFTPTRSYEKCLPAPISLDT